MSALLRVEGLAKRYGELQALRGVSFELRAGELVALVGPNGAGKTTLLSIIAGEQPPSGGSLSPAGLRVGWAPQRPALYSRLSVRENLRLFAELEHVADVGATVAAMLAQAGLQERAQERVGHLSGGNRQRVNVALGLLAEPALLVLDEPSAALDPAQRQRLWEFIERLAERGTAVLYSTHNVAEAQRHARRLLVLRDGTLLFDGPCRQLMAAAGEPSARGDLERALVAYLELADERA